MATTTLTTPIVDTLNGLLRTSLSAQETYKRAIQRIEKDKDRSAVALRVLLDDHTANLEKLSAEVDRLGGSPDHSGGAWGVWSKAMEETAALFGEHAVLRALREGELHGVRLATDAVADPAMEMEYQTRELLGDTVLPSLIEHLDLLDALLHPPK